MAAHLSAPKIAKITAKTVVNATKTFPLSQIHAGTNVTRECAMMNVWAAFRVMKNAKECANNTVLTVDNAEWSSMECHITPWTWTKDLIMTASIMTTSIMTASIMTPISKAQWAVLKEQWTALCHQWTALTR